MLIVILLSIGTVYYNYAEGWSYVDSFYFSTMTLTTIGYGDIAPTSDGAKIYTLEDIYPHADLVTYPSNFEGFGNAFLEAVFFKKPIVVNTYSIYSFDIKPKGFQVIEIDGYVTESAVEDTRKILENQTLCETIVEENYEKGRRYFSYAHLHQKLRDLLSDCFSCAL